MHLPAETFARRRRVLMDRLGPAAAAVFPAAPIAVRSNDVEYPYRQDNDFLYLTGFPEPEAVCLLLPGHPREEFVLFVRPRDPEREVWDGPRAGVDGAKAASSSHDAQDPAPATTTPDPSATTTVSSAPSRRVELSW